MINWNTTKEDAALIAKIVLHVEAACKEYGVRFGKRLNAEMDLTACHLNGCPLDLKKLSEAPDPDLLHDAIGITQHINRDTGKLMDCFSPRCSK